MQLSDCIVHFIKLCNVFGLAPYSQKSGNPKWKLSQLNKIITFVLLSAITAILTLYVFYNKYINDHSESWLTVAILDYAIVIICLNSFFLLSETLFKRNDHIKVQHLFEEFESHSKSFQGIHVDYAYIKSTRNRALLFWITATFGICFMDLLTLIRTRDQNDLFFILCYTLPNLISKLSFVYWIVLVAILHANVKALLAFVRKLNKNIEQCDGNIQLFEVNRWKYRRVHCGRINAVTIEFVSKCYGLIWEASICINHLVYWSFPIGFFNEFSNLVFNCYFLIQIIRMIPNVGVISFIHITSWAASNILNIFFVTSMGERTAETVIIVHLTRFNVFICVFNSFFLSLNLDRVIEIIYCEDCHECDRLASTSHCKYN